MATNDMLLPWHATGQLSPPQARRIGAAIGRNMHLARRFAMVCQERADIIALNESLGAPSPRALLVLFAAIDAEPRKLSC